MIHLYLPNFNIFALPNQSTFEIKSETTNTQNVGNDEIDLLDLFKRMGRTISRWVNSLGKALLISFVFLVKHWLPWV